MSNINALRKNNALDKLLAQVAKEESPTEKASYIDDRLWKPQVDKSGNGYAVLRFLPATDEGQLPWVRVWNHAFQGPTGQWYIENSLTTIKQKDPVSEYNTQLWNSGVESDKEIARKQKRKLQYYANIYVVEDKANPETEGKVFLYKFGKKIFDKLMEAMQPDSTFDDETPINPFDFWEGANFKLKIRKVDGYWNYDKSSLDAPTKLKESDDEIEKIWKNQYALKDFLDASNFKSYDELKKRLDAVLSGTTVTKRAEQMVTEDSEDIPTLKETAPKQKSIASEDDDDTLGYFEQLAKE